MSETAFLEPEHIVGVYCLMLKVHLTPDQKDALANLLRVMWYTGYDVAKREGAGDE